MVYNAQSGEEKYFHDGCAVAVLVIDVYTDVRSCLPAYTILRRYQSAQEMLS